MTRTIAIWMAPVLCFTAQDVADELARATGEPFDVHAASVRGLLAGREDGQPEQALDRRDPPAPRGDPAAAGGVPRRRATSRSRRACASSRRAAERPHWQWSLAHLAELCVRVARRARRGRRGRRDGIAVDEAPGPDLPALLAAHRRGGRTVRAPSPTSACAARPRSPATRLPARAATVVEVTEPAARRKYLLFTVFALISLVLDQWTKVLARHAPAPARPLTRRSSSRLLRPALRGEPGRCFQHAAGDPGRDFLSLVAVGAFLLVLSTCARCRSRADAAARGARAGGRRRARQPHRPRALRARDRLHRVEAWARGTSGRRSTSPTRPCASASGSWCSTCSGRHERCAARRPERASARSGGAVVSRSSSRFGSAAARSAPQLRRAHRRRAGRRHRPGPSRARAAGLDAGRVLDLAFWMTVVRVRRLAARLRSRSTPATSRARASRRAARREPPDRYSSTARASCGSGRAAWSSTAGWRRRPRGLRFARREGWSFAALGRRVRPGARARARVRARWAASPAGCCFGKENGAGWGVAFPRGSVAFDELALSGARRPGRRRHAAAAPDAALRGPGGASPSSPCCWRSQPRLRRRPGALLLLYLGALRRPALLVEMFRGDAARHFVSMWRTPRLAALLHLRPGEPILLSVGEATSLVTLAVVLAVWVRGRGTAPHSAA